MEEKSQTSEGSNEQDSDDSNPFVDNTLKKRQAVIILTFDD